jgi:hypothetical protein
MRLLILAAILLIPAISQAQTLNSIAYLTAFFDSAGNNGVELAPQQLPRKGSLRWIFTRNSRGVLKLRSGNLAGITCSKKGNQIRCPKAYALPFDNTFGNCTVRANHILTIGTKAYTMKATRDTRCPDIDYAFYIEYIGLRNFRINRSGQ